MQLMEAVRDLYFKDCFLGYYYGDDTQLVDRVITKIIEIKRNKAWNSFLEKQKVALNSILLGKDCFILV